MATVLQDIEAAVQEANAAWTGTHYVVVSTKDYGVLASAGISQIVFSGWSIEYANTSALSSRVHRIPIKYIPGTVTFRGAVERNTALYDRFWVQQRYLKGQDIPVPENIVIVTYPLGQGVPISIIVAVGCQAVSYKHADADANGTSMPLEELVIQPHDIFRVTGGSKTFSGITRDLSGSSLSFPSSISGSLPSGVPESVSGRLP